MLRFEDDSFFTVTTQMWGAMELFVRGEECQRQYIRGMRPVPDEPEFTFDYFSNLVAELRGQEKRSVKGLLTQDQIIPGLGNAVAQDILFRRASIPATQSTSWTRASCAACTTPSARRCRRLPHRVGATMRPTCSATRAGTSA